MSIVKRKDVIEFFKFIIIASVIVLPIRMFIAQPFIVSGESMFPTFHNGEYLIVDQLSYYLRQPQRGEVLIFRYPEDPSKFFIKRIIALPNEEVKINNGVVTITNNENEGGFVLNEPYVKEIFHTTETYKTKADEYFVMGDNRNRSSDSRVWGKVPKKLLVGRAYLRLFPVANASFLPGSIKEN